MVSLARAILSCQLHPCLRCWHWYCVLQPRSFAFFLSLQIGAHSIWPLQLSFLRVYVFSTPMFLFASNWSSLLSFHHFQAHFPLLVNSTYNGAWNPLPFFSSIDYFPDIGLHNGWFNWVKEDNGFPHFLWTFVTKLMVKLLLYSFVTHIRFFNTVTCLGFWQLPMILSHLDL